MLTKAQFRKRFSKVSPETKIRHWLDAVQSGDTLSAQLLECVLASRIPDGKDRLIKDEALHTKRCGIFRAQREVDTPIGAYAPVFKKFVIGALPSLSMSSLRENQIPQVRCFGFLSEILNRPKLITEDFTITDEGCRRLLLYSCIGNSGWCIDSSSIIGDEITRYDWSRIGGGGDRSPVLVSRQLHQHLPRENILALVKELDTFGYPDSELGAALKHISNFVSY